MTQTKTKMRLWFSGGRGTGVYVDGRLVEWYVCFDGTQVAQAVGVQKAAISKIEVGQGLPSANILARLCEIYGVEISDITNRASAPELDAA